MVKLVTDGGLPIHWIFAEAILQRRLDISSRYGRCVRGKISNFPVVLGISGWMNSKLSHMRRLLCFGLARVVHSTPRYVRQ